MNIYSENLLVQIFEEVSTFYTNIKQVYTEIGYYNDYPLSSIWESNVTELFAIINSSSSVVDKLHAVHNTFFFSINTNNEVIKEKMIDWYIDYIENQGYQLSAFPLDIQESPYANPQNSIVREERLVAPDFLRTVIIALEIDKYCDLPNSGFKILELGAGYGGLARTLKLFHPNTNYYIVDIPESLCFSYIFLRINFPESKFLIITSNENIEPSIYDKYDFVFIPSIFAERLVGKEFDLFCNTASLGEMRNSVIQYWMTFVQEKISIKYFFGLNRYLNTIIPEVHKSRLDENQCSVLFDKRWKILQWELEPPFTRCPYLETAVTRNLEVIAQRLPKVNTDDDHNRIQSQQLIEKLFLQDWFVYWNDDNSMILRDNILVPDLTIKGTLFSLWESIRLDHNLLNLYLMIKYLNTLTRGKPFEEIFYYLELFQELNKDSKEFWLVELFATVNSYRDNRLPLQKISIEEELNNLYLFCYTGTNPKTQAELQKLHIQAIENLQETIKGMEKSIFWRTRNIWFKIKYFLGLTKS